MSQPIVPSLEQRLAAPLLPQLDAETEEQLRYYLADVPDATPAEIREAVSEFLDRDPREDA